MTQTDKMLSRKEGGVGYLIFNNPERHNAVSLDMWEAAQGILADFAADKAVRVVVVTGAGGKAFVSGADISKFESERSSKEAIDRYNIAVDKANTAVYEFPKPTIAMIRGYCIGGGVGLALCCDLRICSDNSKFGVPAAKLGLGYGFKGIKKLVDVVGPSFAKEIFFTARQFTAAEALAMGLVNRVLPEAELEKYVKDYADTISGNAPLTVNSVKYIVGEAVKDESERNLQEMRRPGGAMLRQQRLYGRPQGVHGKAQAGFHRHIRKSHSPTNGEELRNSGRICVASVELRGLTKRYGDVAVVDDISLAIEHGHLVCLLGPSGCGKTTTLRLIAGFVEPSAGEIRVGDKLISSPAHSLPPERRNMSMIFQSYALWPHMTVAENIVYGLKLRKMDRDTIAKKLDAILATTKLAPLAERYPGELSGGQQQRVALARALIVEPETLLLDEPLSNLDANLREEMRFEVRRLHDAYRYTTVYVTHDQSEAMTTADLIAVMNAGKIEQAGSPEDIYDRPRSEFVARFIGSSNVVKGKAQRRRPHRLCRRRAALRRREADGRRRHRGLDPPARHQDFRDAAAAGGKRRAGDGDAAGLSRRQPGLYG